MRWGPGRREHMPPKSAPFATEGFLVPPLFPFGDAANLPVYLLIRELFTEKSMKTEYDQNVWNANYQDEALLLIEDKVALLLAVGLAQIAEEVADELGIPVEMAESELPDMVARASVLWLP